MLLNRIILSEGISSALFSEIFNKDSQTNKNRAAFIEHLNENVKVTETETGYVSDFADLDLSFLDDEEDTIQDTFQYVSEYVYMDCITYTSDKSRQFTFNSYEAIHMEVKNGQVTSRTKCEKANSIPTKNASNVSMSYHYIAAA